MVTLMPPFALGGKQAASMVRCLNPKATTPFEGLDARKAANL